MTSWKSKRYEGQSKNYSSAVLSVQFTKGSEGSMPYTKTGILLYDGKASEFHEWEFRTRLRIRSAGTDAEDYAKSMSKIVEGLKGNAFTVAKDIGFEKSCTPAKPLSSSDQQASTEVLGDDGLELLIKKCVKWYSL